MTTYSVTVVNNSRSAWKFFLYQTPPGHDLDLVSLAWLALPFKVPNGGASTRFYWQTNYQFVWSTTAIVKPGKIIKASGLKSCDPQGANTTTFTLQGSTPVFSDPVSGGNKGTLYINDDAAIPSQTYAVGIGMSDNPTFVVNAEPNMTHPLTPTPVNSVYIAAIDEVEQGEVIDLTTLNKTAQIEFPTGVYNMTATFQAYNMWTFTA